ncbi:hypothetical protein AM499_12105 [Bacillus sp. FJAT-22090]|uniref:lipopolysaccharide biosynthesis protein n=1 Tax=Bacillus sp. FJAT-22090 TaxID=1581038 RepID=UPI0006AE6429|nr:hypothetical protein [Bacillus sp. FJAT-22090]ALC86485.1 hypothetical protein AM499_12105 [Bacillus sp. FJAT-22090]
MNKKKFLYDSIINLFSSAMPLLILQLVSLPTIAKKLSSSDYGLIVTIISLFTIISFPLGNVLNNVRLLMEREYKKRNIIGDFNILLLVSTLISLIVITATTLIIDKKITIINFILLIMITILNLLKEYYIVSFRLNLNYKGIFINNILLSIGYLVGTYIFYISGYWQVIFLMGLFFSTIYIFKNSDLPKEKYRRTTLFKKVTLKSITLYISSFLKISTTYLDKILLFPLLGSAAVSVYYTADILGKIITMMINPINTVILSYLVKIEKINLKKFISMFCVSFVVGSVGYIITIVISPAVLKFLYPEWASEALNLIYITTASAVINVFNSVLNPFNLRFNNIKWQIIINAINLGVYIGAAYYFFLDYGLIGFSFGILIANIFKFVMQFMLFTLSYYHAHDEVQ